MTSRREITVGLAADVLRYGEPVSQWRPRRRGYVSGPRDDSGPLTAVLWEDLAQAYERQHIPDEDAAIFERWLDGESIGGIARRTSTKERPVAKSTIQSTVDRIKPILEADPEIGLLAVVLESCGGWEAVRDVLRD